MPGEVIDRPNPPALPSHIPDYVDGLIVKLEKTKLKDDVDVAVKKWQRAANYIAAAMIFLKDNVLIERDLTPEDIKPRLLGHWGTCPGLNLVYSHLNRLIIEHDLNMLYVVGPGHGAPAILASLWLEGSMEKFYSKYSRNTEGLTALITKFSTPTGFPSHINAELPGCIHEGGELGYALSVSFGAIMDNPDLIVTCIVGDGEAESGPTATAWHSYKFIDPAESGAVLPIVHVNGFKISERTIYGCMDDRELAALFTGYGYKPVFVGKDMDAVDAELAAAMDWAVGEIKNNQKAARGGNPITKPQWPVIILRTPKGWTGPKEIHGHILEGSFESHQVPLPKAKTDKEELAALQSWLTAYKPEELFTEAGEPVDEIKSIVPKDKKALGQNVHVNESYKPLTDVDWRPLCAEKGKEESPMKAVGSLLDKLMVANPKSLRLFSPDELCSNKLDAVFDHTGRNFQWDQYSQNQGGRVIETLSEHQCQGFLQGYTLTGRVGIFPSYESFLGIVHTMMVQYSKFNKMARESEWRKDISSINYIETSTWTRQEHNGFSHQNPSFIGAVLNLKPTAARVYFPPDANTFLSTISHCLRSKNYVNLMVGTKSPSPILFTPEEADAHCQAGGGIIKQASTEDGLNPDVVLVGIGAEINFEVIVAAKILQERCPELRIRVINVTDIMILSATDNTHPHALSDDAYAALFCPEVPVHFNYHGYGQEIKGLLFGRPHKRITFGYYIEEGSTTTPFDMMLVNKVSRFHVAINAIKGAALKNEKVRLRQHELVTALERDIKKTQDYVRGHGTDVEGTYDMPKF
ncbi:putative phosphoketolase [Tothia fuscella]|uniref:Phosphoketolase n=1 Tax=Tothia fuscella TaxID=1048955 RepID=A0A9P4NUS4_9PEZI|nr:putative phosphoketolase [Tothia fuscella]